MGATAFIRTASLFAISFQIAANPQFEPHRPVIASNLNPSLTAEFVNVVFHSGKPPR
jgi:hypothetical protein